MKSNVKTGEGRTTLDVCADVVHDSQTRRACSPDIGGYFDDPFGSGGLTGAVQSVKSNHTAEVDTADYLGVDRFGIACVR